MKKKNPCIAVIGGDNRQGYLADALAGDGMDVIVNGLEKYPGLHKTRFISDTAEAIEQADILILPVPVSHDGVTVNAPYSYAVIYLSDILAMAAPDQLILGGKIDAGLRASLADQGLRAIDYLAREELSVRNAVPTVEGALAIAINETPITLFGSRCLVIGYGRLGKVLAACLKHLGAQVTVSARKQSDLAWILTAGCRPVQTAGIYEELDGYDVIFNTAPALLLGRRELQKCRQDTVIIDLASAPGGLDYDAAQQLGIKAIQALSLPGKTAPASAALIIKDTIFNIIREETV
ncbi:MAG: dipicolinate synthase subunit DpsA [Clostridiales bacterium]|nr:dipicolinate synthase subunit DpsA [Clostridiales bacterium]